MKRKIVNMFLGLSVGMAVIGSGMPVAAEETTDVAVVLETETNTEAAVETEAEAAATVVDNTESEASAETATETEAESEETDFVEGSAVLSDYEYKKGTLSEEGWSSEFLNMIYTPDADAGITMGIDENEAIAEYYERNGEDKQVAINEMVAVDEKDGYVQIMVEVNPNNEAAEDILIRFKDTEGFQLASTAKETEIAGRTFLTTTGVVDSERYMIGVCTEEDGLVIALKVKYENTTARAALLEGFDVIEIEETEDELTADIDNVLEEAESIMEEEEAAGTETAEDVVVSSEEETEAVVID